MLTELCQEIRNWFVRKDADMHHGTFEIRGGAIIAPFLVSGQYYRIIGSIFNDGVHQYGKEADGELTDETWDGSVWALAIPKEIVELAGEIEAWRAKYEAADSPAMSPFTSENYFGDYSYSKSGGGNGASGSAAASWKLQFSAALNRWRKIL